MNIEIQVLNVDVTEHKNTKGGTYKKAEVAYKDLGSGKTQSKKIMSFGKTEKAFLSIVSNGVGKYDVEMEKDGDYWIFISATPSSAKASSVASKEAQPSGQAQPASKFQEDKDKVQKYIVRQSSLKAAVDYFGNAGNKKVTVDEIVQTAAKFESYVFDEYSPETFQESIQTNNDDVVY